MLWLHVVIWVSLSSLKVKYFGRRLSITFRTHRFLSFLRSYAASQSFSKWGCIWHDDRLIKLCRILVPVLFSRGLMVENLLEVIFWHMLLQQDFFCVRVVAKKELPRLSIPLVSRFGIAIFKILQNSSLLRGWPFPDCPEREATYIITTGGINDPEKA